MQFGKKHSTGGIGLPGDIAQNQKDTLRRPILPSYPKTSFGCQNRAFSCTLYNKFDFIEYSMQKDSIYCFPCRFFGSGCGHSQETVFTHAGFKNWKRCERIQEHSICHCHRESVVAWLEFLSTKKVGDVVQQLNSYHAKLVENNRDYIKSLARIALMCGRQNIAFRGHREISSSCNRGNFLEIVELLETESTEFKKRKSSMPANATYLSSDSQNALLEAGARCILKQIQDEVERSAMFAIITDCCTDMVDDNLSVSIRFVNMNDYTVNERFLKFVELSANELDAESLTNKIVSTLCQEGRFQIKLDNCVAQASDGASVMSGKHNGVQKQFRDRVKNPCIFVHCYAHRLNLVLSVSVSSVQCAKEFFDLLKGIITFINGSVRRKQEFSKAQENDDSKLQVLVLPDLCDHKWNFRERAVSVIHSRYSHLVQAFASIADDGKTDEKPEAEGYLLQLKMPTNICLLVILSDVFTQLGTLSEVLQSEKLDVASAMQLASAHTSVLKEKRSDEYFEKVWTLATNIASKDSIELTIPTVGKRPRKQPSALKRYLVDSTVGHRDNGEESTQTDAKSYYRRSVFFPVIDRLVSEMEARFNDPETSPLLSGIAACHPESAKFLDSEILQPLVEAYKLDSSGSLQSQIVVCKLFLSKMQKPTNISELIAILQPSSGFPDLRRLLQLALTVPIANVAAERSFSSMRRIRTYVRSSMTENRLSSIAILHIESELSWSINMDSFVNMFAKLPVLRDTNAQLGEENARRIPLLTPMACEPKQD